jgi:hypothetical protein
MKYVMDISLKMRSMAMFFSKKANLIMYFLKEFQLAFGGMYLDRISKICYTLSRQAKFE